MSSMTNSLLASRESYFAIVSWIIKNFQLFLGFLFFKQTFAITRGNIGQPLERVFPQG